jgi:branched-chain amino acid transport system substrate-binding protein
MRWSGRARTGAVVVVVALAAACGNAEPSAGPDDTGDSSGDDSGDDSGGGDPTGSFPSVDAPGVTDTEIKVGGVASVTNPIGGSYGNAFDGVEAYFDMINAAGGIYGRQLVLEERKDDSAVNNKAMVGELLDADIFAVLPVHTLLFTGADDLVAAGVPTFGWTINPEWSGDDTNPKANLFGQSGSYLGLGEPAAPYPYLADELGVSKVGILAYAVPQSAQCAETVERSFEEWAGATDAEVVFSDANLAFGDKNLSVQVSAMKDAGVDFVTTCLDTNGVVTLATEMDKQGLDAIQYLPNGYDHAFVEQFGDLFEGSIVRTDFVPFEVPEEDRPEGLADFLSQMDELGLTPTENTVAGWMNAALFVDGLKAAGPDFDRQKVIDALNAMTDWTGDGLTFGVDWTKQHTGVARDQFFCQSFVTIEDGAFVTNFGEPGKPFTCVDGSDEGELVVTNES